MPLLRKALRDKLTRAESHSTEKISAPRGDVHAPICITDLKATEKTATKMARQTVDQEPTKKMLCHQICISFRGMPALRLTKHGNPEALFTACLPVPGK
jgi:hypothetical protein